MKVGDKVTVTFDGTVNAVKRGSRFSAGGFIPDGGMHFGEDGDSGFVEVKDAHGNRHVIWHETTPWGKSDNVMTVTQSDPDNWPPKSGDVWTSDGEAYGVRDHTYMPGVVVSAAGRIGGHYSDSYGAAREKLSAFKALNPTLLFRKDAE